MNVAAGSRKKKKPLYLIFYKVTCLDSTTRQIVTGMLLLCIKTKENLEIKAILTNIINFYGTILNACGTIGGCIGMLDLKEFTDTAGSCIVLFGKQ